MAESLHIGADVFAALGKYTQAVFDAAHESTKAEKEAIYNSVMEAARAHPAWQGVADYIEVWDTDGGYEFGVRHPDYVEAALKAEYGDKDTPPAPILRNTRAYAEKAYEASERSFRELLGTSNPHDH